MISIIICTRRPHALQELSENVSQTIGVPFETVLVDNSDNRYSLCAAYNEGVRRAKGDILCFMHDDITLYTPGWGRNVERHFESPEVGMIGPVGSHLIPSEGDWRVGYAPFHVLHFIQQNHTLSPYSSYFSEHVRDGLQGLLTEVATLDGVWFCLPKALFDEGIVRFDEERFTSFHIYDLDISMQVVHAGKKLYVVDDVLLEHQSQGVYNEYFVTSLTEFLKKWDGQLPVTRGMNMDIEKLIQQAPHYRDELLRRIENDRDVLAIRNHWKEAVSGTRTTSLTARQKEMVSFSEFIFIKNVMKYHPDKQAASQQLKLRWGNLSASHRIQILWKYFVYRILRIPCKKKSMNFFISNGNPTPAAK